MKSNYIPAEIRYGELFASFANSFREIAFEIDEEPSKIKQYSHLPAIDFLISDRDSTTFERTCYLEAFAYGDPGVLLASPGPSVAGLMLRELGLPEQITEFYTLLREKRMTTFFALTEKEKGSDAMHIDTRLHQDIFSKNNYTLQGEKYFSGNASIADMGIVLAKISDGPMGMRAVWLTNAILNSSNIERV